MDDISITNLAERHLRHLTMPTGNGSTASNINHESSRKAFETNREVDARAGRRIRISITNLAERHLRLEDGDPGTCYRRV